MKLSAIFLSILLMLGTLVFTGCGGPSGKAPELPHWTFSPDMLFTANGTLLRPEDGVILPDGRLVVADQVAGLRVVEENGGSRPFGNMVEAGYVHNPPAVEAGANGVTMDPTGTFILVADMYQSGIYKVDIASETTELFYQHEFGVNVARADTRGGIWFTQSTRNRPEENSAALWESVNIPVADGALYYIAPNTDKNARKAVLLADGFLFANGIAFDESKGEIYVAESMGNCVYRFNADFAAGTVSGKEVAFDVSVPDNLEFDEYGRLWVACPLRMELVVADVDNGTTESVFRISSPESEKLIADIIERLENNEPWMDLAGPGLWSPSDAFITGMVLDPDNDTVYAAGLGSSVIKLEN